MISYFILCGFFKSICQNPTYFIITLFSQKVLKLNGCAKRPCLVKTWYDTHSQLSCLQILVLLGHQGGGLKASSIFDVWGQYIFLQSTSSTVDMYKDEHSEDCYYREKSQLCQRKSLFENIKWGSYWLFAQSSTVRTRKGLLKEREHSRYSSFHKLPQGHIQ